MVYSTDLFKAVVPVLVLLFGLFCEAICCMSYLVPFCSCFFFSSFSIAITSLGEERANLSPFCMFDRFVLVWICQFPFSLDVWEGLLFVIVALPGLFSYLCYYLCHCIYFFNLYVCPGNFVLI